MHKLSNDDLKKLIDLYSTDLLHLCYLYVNDLDAASDILQTVFLKVYLNYDTFRNESSEKTWITRITINECKNYLKSVWRRKIILTNTFIEKSYDFKVNSYDCNELIKLVEQLPIKYKEIIVLYYYEELNMREISSILHIRQSTISSRLKKARILLETRMKKENVYEKFQSLL